MMTTKPTIQMIRFTLHFLCLLHTYLFTPAWIPLQCACERSPDILAPMLRPVLSIADPGAPNVFVDRAGVPFYLRAGNKLHECAVA
jgi:hypothetical protein